MRRFLLVATFLLLAWAAPARADLILNLQSVSVSAGSTGYALDVTLTNTGTSGVSVGEFGFEISTPTSNIDFTGTTTSTALAPYIFGGNSVFGPIIATGTGQILDASDVNSPLGSGATVGAGATVGLGHVLFNVASGTPDGPISVQFTAGPATVLSGPNGKAIQITSLGTGTIDVAAVPEPSMVALTAIGGFGLVGVIRRRSVLRTRFFNLTFACVIAVGVVSRME